MSRKTLTIGVAAFLILAAFLAWLFIESSKPLLGTKLPDLGRGHVQVGSVVDYNSNPPTSGPHYSEWVKAGVYESERDDRNLVHSLEHGYVILSYKCKVQSARLEEATESGEVVKDEGCEERKNQLAKVYEKKGKRKLIIVPRANLDTNFALTAWTYLDKFNEFDQNRIEKFIDVHKDQGPERTME